MSERSRGTAWVVASLTVGVSAVLAAVGPRHVHLATLAVTLAVGAGLAVRAVLTTRELVAPPGWPERRRVLALMAGGCGLVLIAGLAHVGAGLPVSLALPDGVPVVFAVIGAQAFLAGAATRPVGSADAQARRVLPLTAHALTLTGAVFTFHPSSGGAGAVAAGTGLALLALTAYWSHRSDAPKDTEGWDAVFLAGLAAGLVAVISFPFAPDGIVLMTVRVLAAAGIVAALAALARPPAAPDGLRAHNGYAARVLAHGVAGVGIVNALFLTIAFTSTWSAQVAFVLLLAWLVVIATMEYGAVRHAMATRAPAPREGGRVPEEIPLTLIVCARDDARALEESVAANLRALPPHVRVLLVPSVSSTDGTVDVARRFAREHPERVSVLDGTGGSKARDLNEAVAQVEDEIILLLDADETLTEAALAEGLRVLEEDPDAGVVQGRKVPHADEASRPLARFILTERRHSTGLDQAHQADALDAAHFAGSAALVRRAAVRDAGGWSDWCLTEDIEFSLRLHLDTRWRIRFAPRMVVRESPPADLAGLLKQRARWARGWTQCFLAYFPRILRERARLGRRRASGLAWVLFSAVSAPLATLLPALLVLRLTGFTPLLPVLVTLPIALVALPSRFIGFAFSAFTDPVAPVPDRAPRRMLTLLGHAAGWIVLGWAIQLHALHQEVAAAPREWFVTRKTARVDAAA